MKVHQVMKKIRHAIGIDTPLRVMWKTIFKEKVHALPVVDKKGLIIGIVSEEDLLKPLYPNYTEVIEDYVSASDFEEMEEKIHELTKLKAKHVMNKTVIFTRTETPIMRALARMITRKVSQLPVLSEESVLIGIITKGDIFDALFKKHLRLRGFEKHSLQSLREHITKSKKFPR